MSSPGHKSGMLGEAPRQFDRIQEHIENLFDLAYDGDIDAFRARLDALSKFYPQIINVADISDGKTLIHLAAIMGNIPLLVFLLDNGANIDVQDFFGLTPLLHAISKTQTDAAILLIGRRANVSRSDFKGNTPLHFAATMDNFIVVDALLSKGVDCKLLNHSNRTPGDCTSYPEIRRKIEYQHDLNLQRAAAGDTRHADAMKWMGLGVGVGLGVGMALAQQQFLLNQQREQEQRELERQQEKKRQAGGVTSAAGRRVSSTTPSSSIAKADSSLVNSISGSAMSAAGSSGGATAMALTDDDTKNSLSQPRISNGGFVPNTTRTRRFL